jgi:hypothetical protein
VGRKTGKKYFEGGSLGARRAAHTQGHLHRSLFGAATPHAPDNVLRGREEANGAVHHDREELPEMRRETVELVRKAVTENRRVYVLVNHRSEGPAPLTVQALAKMLRSEVSVSIAQ